MATAFQFVNETTVESPREYSAAQGMAAFFFASFWAIVFTGSVRKWLFPGVTILYLLQDVPIGLAFVYGLWKGLFSRGYIMLGILLLSIVLFLQGMLQIIFTGLSGVVAIIGLHNYLFYLPILVFFPLCLTEKYRRQFIRYNLLFSIPMCLLAIAQNESPKNAWVNRTSEGEGFGLPGAEVARVSGTFNFTVYYGIWVAIAVALCLGEWLLPKERRVFRSQWMLILVTFTVNLCHLVSASRSAILLAGTAVLGALVCAFILGSGRAILAIGGILFLLPVAAGMTYFISPEEFNIVVQRFSGEHEQQDMQSRIEEGLIGFATEPQFSMIGAGIGMGVDASHVGSSETYNFTYQLSENDTVRTVMELGTPVGLLYMLTRIALVLGMVFLAVRIVRDGSSPHVLPLSFCLLAQAYQGDLTRAASMTASQVMMGYAFILGAYYHPDNQSELESTAGNLLTRSA